MAFQRRGEAMKAREETKRTVWPVLSCVLLVFVLAEAAQGVVIDDHRTLEFIAKLQSRVSLRLQDSQGFTEPELSVGDLVQWRNIAYLEVSHDLKHLMGSIDLMQPLSRWGVEVKYRLVGRFMYEAVYNVGPQALQEVRDRDPANIDRFKEAYDLWEAYGDLAKGPVFFRIGRQNLSWGETDVFRLLDTINPLDNTYGGIFEDLDDRRIPLWMLRGSYNFGNVGPASSLTVEGFWVPGNWDAMVAPVAPGGTPYATPLAPAPVPVLIETPRKVMSNSRWGARLQGVLFDSVNLSVAHYKSYMDLPSSVLNVEETGGLIPDVALSVYYDDIQVTGGALNFWEMHLDVVIRAEAAMFWKESVFIPEENAPLIPTGLPIPGFEALPAQGHKTERDILRWMIGFDKNIWIRKLNKTQTFFWSMQYFGQYILNYDERIKQAVPIYPDDEDYAGLREVEGTFTFMMNTSYMSGQINPQLVLAYDARGAFMFQPQVNFLREPFRFLIQYSGIYGSFTNFGFFRDRDQVSFVLSYLLN
jgi:hypothetical protein